MNQFKQISKEILESKLAEINSREFFSYSKTRVSGSKNNSYFMHQRSTCMPGQKKIFVLNATTNPKEKSESNMLMIREAYTRDKYLISKKAIGNKSIKDSLDFYTFNSFHPYDDESLEMVIIASYKQVYGNFKPMQSERSIDAERRLRNGDITVREFIRLLSSSEFYRYNFFERISQKKCIQLNFMHFLGRPLINEKELQINIELINTKGFNRQIDSLINSTEYQEFFGEDIVPFQRFWNSPCGATTQTFIKTASYRNGYPSSDNVDYR